MDVSAIRRVPERTLSRGAHRVVEVVLEVRLERRVGHAPSLAPGVRRVLAVRRHPASRAGVGLGTRTPACEDGPMDPLARAAVRTVGGLVGAGVAGVGVRGARGAHLVHPAPVCRARPAARVGARADPPGVRPAPDARPGEEDRVGPRPRGARARLRRQHRRQPRAPEAPCRPLLRAMEPLVEFPGAFVLGSNDYFGPVPKNPALYLTRRYAEVRAVRSDLPVGDLVDGSARRRLGRPRQRAHHGDDGRPPRRARRCQRPPHRLRPVCRGVRSRGRRRRADDGSGPRALPARARRDGRRRRLGRPRGPHPRRPARPAGLGGPRHQLRPRHPPREGPLPLVAGGRHRRSRRLGGPSSSAPDDAAWLHVSAGLGTSPYAPVRFACRPEATLLTLLARDA